MHRELGKEYGVTVTIRAPRQTGKSSLLIRGVASAQMQGCKAVSIDLQPVEDSYFSNMDTFLHYFATVLVTKLRLDTTEVERAWKSSHAAPRETSRDAP